MSVLGGKAVMQRIREQYRPTAVIDGIEILQCSGLLRSSDSFGFGRMPKHDSEQLRFPPRTWLPGGGTVQPRGINPKPSGCFGPKGRGKMVPERAYSPGSLPFIDRPASPFYFPPTVPSFWFLAGL